MQITFYDIKKSEANYLKTNCPSSLVQIYRENSINSPLDIEGDDIKSDIISCFTNSNLNEDIISRFPNLKYILARSVGFNHIDINYCKKHNIKVLYTPHYGDWTVAEFAFSILLSVTRKIKEASLALKMGEVNQDDFEGIELHSKTIGIIGLGQIGERTARIAKGFDMKIIYFDIKEHIEYKKVSLEYLCKTSDIIVIHCPLNEKTRHLINEKTLSFMKKDVVIINVARGEIIDTDALINAIENNKIGFCALDVIECEYITMNLAKKDFCKNCVEENCIRKYMLNQKLLSYKNVLITPHIAYNTKEAVERILRMTVQNIDCIVKSNFEDCKNRIVC